MIEIVKKMPIIIALLTGKPLMAQDAETGEQYELTYSVKDKIFKVLKTQFQNKINITFKREQNATRP